MEKLNSLLYSILLLTVVTTSANAEWKMFASEQGTYMYCTETGATFKYNENTYMFRPELYVDNKEGGFSYKSPSYLIADSIKNQNKPKTK